MSELEEQLTQAFVTLSHQFKQVQEQQAVQIVQLSEQLQALAVQTKCLTAAYEQLMSVWQEEYE